MKMINVMDVEKLDVNEGQSQVDEDTKMHAFDNIFEMLRSPLLKNSFKIVANQSLFIVLPLYVFGFHFVF